MSVDSTDHSLLFSEPCATDSTHDELNCSSGSALTGARPSGRQRDRRRPRIDVRCPGSVGTVARRAQRPFAIHQFAEYLIGTALISFAFQDPEPMVPVAMGIVVVGIAAFSAGPLGAFRAIPRGVHRWVNIAEMVAMVVAAAQPWIPVSPVGRLALVGLCLPFGFSWFYTDWSDRKSRRERRTAAGSDTGARVGATAGRLAGRGWNKAKQTARSVNERTK